MGYLGFYEEAPYRELSKRGPRVEGGVIGEGIASLY